MGRRSRLRRPGLLASCYVGEVQVSSPGSLSTLWMVKVVVGTGMYNVPAETLVVNIAFYELCLSWCLMGRKWVETFDVGVNG